MSGPGIHSALGCETVMNDLCGSRIARSLGTQSIAAGTSNSAWQRDQPLACVVHLGALWVARVPSSSCAIWGP
eukprot:1808835-Alexandrium_andersonii.AAC.1